VSFLSRVKAIQAEMRIGSAAASMVDACDGNTAGCEAARGPALQARNPAPVVNPDPAIALQDFHERLAICAEAGDVSVADALGIATEHAGASIDELANRQVTQWLAHLVAMPLPSNRELASKRPQLVEIARQPWLLDAARLGWSDVALFGIHPGAPSVRIECWGLAIRMALSPFNASPSQQRAQRVRLKSIDANTAVLETPSGAHSRMLRCSHGFDVAVPVWSLTPAHLLC